MTNTRPYRACRLRALAAGVAVAAGALLSAAAPASASEQRCHYDGLTFNACLTIGLSPRTFSAFWYEAEVGLDRVMPVNYARELLSFPCNADFKAELWGEDGATDQFIRPLQILPGYPTSTSTGLSAGFASLAGPIGSQLDEDRGENIDEVYAKISYVDCHIGSTRQTYDTGVLVRDFQNAGR